jgi:hypothetical protein
MLTPIKPVYNTRLILMNLYISKPKADLSNSAFAGVGKPMKRTV